MELDKFYTRKSVANKCYKQYKKIQQQAGLDLTLLEPSAGDGIFLDIFQDNNESYLALDISPEDSRIKKQDFFKFKAKKKYCVIGNPPFGKRGLLALDFMNKAMELSPLVGFIVPKTFCKYSIQKNINHNFMLVSEVDLKDCKYRTGEKTTTINTLFQVWLDRRQVDESKFVNNRIVSPPPTKHDDFELFLHNNTTKTLKYYDKDVYQWDFAVCRQGYYDYNSLIYDESELKNNVQYMFIKANNRHALKILKKIDYEKLSKKYSTTIPGFGKADLIKEYNFIRSKNGK